MMKKNTDKFIDAGDNGKTSIMYMVNYSTNNKFMKLNHPEYLRLKYPTFAKNCFLTALNVQDPGKYLKITRGRKIPVDINHIGFDFRHIKNACNYNYYRDKTALHDNVSYYVSLNIVPHASFAMKFEETREIKIKKQGHTSHMFYHGSQFNPHARKTLYNHVFTIQN
jgi:hypothetical protein